MDAKQRRKELRAVRRLITTDKLVALRIMVGQPGSVLSLVNELAPTATYRTRIKMALEINAKLMSLDK